MDTRIYKSRDLLGAAAAERFSEIIKNLLEDREEVNIIFAAAPSQNEFLQQLESYAISWNKINAFHMDEYIDLEADAPQGFGNFLKSQLFDRFPFKSVHYLNGNASDTKAECDRYAKLLRDFPVDFVCMGIGENGHLAFNDPPVADFQDILSVKVVELDEICRTQQVNDGCFKAIEFVPTHALTLTIPALLSAQYINCVVSGSTKASAVRATIQDEISTSCPSTILRTHENSVLFLDKESSGLL